MQVILRTDIERLGRLGDVVEVKPGYARNYLLPRDMAMEATPGNMKDFENQRQKLQERLDKARSDAERLAGQLQDLKLRIPVRVGEGDKLYGSVTTAMIADALAEQGFDLDKKKIELDKPIRSLGQFSVPVKVYPEVRPEIKVAVVRHGEEHEEHEEDEQEPEQESEQAGEQ
ncbi:MAG: 50S ribosomal protein L9 [Desulfohalobiaceae bacterium]|nr:50S ribosomal protein L9 [Desulfohalobiaceae bacterium]